LLEAGADPNIADEVLMDLVFGFAIYLVWFDTIQTWDLLISFTSDSCVVI
jgi:hypothetical protein